MQDAIGKYGNVIFTSAVVGLVLLMVLPLPTFLLDLLLALDIALSITILIVALSMRQPLDFSGFPAVLLVATLFRLTLNIASTRLILLNGGDGPEAAGDIIATFGEFVIGGNYVVGVIVFTILVVINFIVITKGSGRIAEVGARFTLDAMPGKQMAIDAELNAGLLTEDEARKRRSRVQEEADFYGAMDGASKFVRGDSIAGILITVINIVGGFIIGMTQHGMSAADAGATFTILTVGDGLVSQIPSLVISTAAGIIVSRAAGSADLGTQIISQLFSAKKVMRMVAVILFGFGLLPGMPAIIFFGVGGLALLAASRLNADASSDGAKASSQGKPDAPAAAAPPAPEKIESLLPLDILQLEVGYGLIPLVDRVQGGALLERIQGIRKQFAKDMGIIVPSVHIQDNFQRPNGGYALSIKGVEIAAAELVPDRFLAMNSGDVLGKLPGVETIEPAFGMPAVWIDGIHKDRAEQLGYMVVDCPTVIATHLAELLRTHAHELLGRQELQGLLDVVKEQAPKVVEELVPDRMSLGDVLRVLRNLLREQVSVRDLRTILEALADHLHLTKNTEILTEFVRHRLARYISNRVRAEDGKIHVITVDGTLEEHFRGHMQQVDGDFHLTVSPKIAEGFVRDLETKLERQSTLGHAPVVLVAPELRRAVRNLLERFLPQAVVISHKEIATGYNVSADGDVGRGLAEANAPARGAGRLSPNPA